MAKFCTIIFLVCFLALSVYARHWNNTVKQYVDDPIIVHKTNLTLSDVSPATLDPNSLTSPAPEAVEKDHTMVRRRFSATSSFDSVINIIVLSSRLCHHQLLCQTWL